MMLISAEVAREYSKQAADKEKTRLFTEIAKLIEAACDEGKYQIRLDLELPLLDYIKDQLQSIGYRVTSTAPNSTIISWAYTDYK